MLGNLHIAIIVEHTTLHYSRSTCRTPAGVNSKRIGTVITEITSMPSSRTLIGLSNNAAQVEMEKGQDHKVKSDFFNNSALRGKVTKVCAKLRMEHCVLWQCYFLRALLPSHSLLSDVHMT